MDEYIRMGNRQRGIGSRTGLLAICLVIVAILFGCAEKKVELNLENERDLITVYTDVRSEDFFDSKAIEEIPTSYLNQESIIVASQLDSQLKIKNDLIIVDVREPNEFEEEHLPSAFNLPLEKLEGDLNLLPKDREIILICRSGNRAFTAWQKLVELGYNPSLTKVLVGGMEQWNNLGSSESTESIGGC